MFQENILSFQTAGIIPASTFVKFQDEKTIVQATSSKDSIIGISDTTIYYNNEIADIYLQGANCEIKLGATVSAGDALTSDENGHAIKAQNSDNIGAIALNSGLEGEIIKAVVTINRTIAQNEETNTEANDENSEAETNNETETNTEP